MLFIIEYDRLRGEIVSMTTHPDDARPQVDEARLQTELRLRSEAAKHEVVVLEAANEDALRKTHARYFKSAQALVPSTGAQVRATATPIACSAPSRS